MRHWSDEGKQPWRVPAAEDETRERLGLIDDRVSSPRGEVVVVVVVVVHIVSEVEVLGIDSGLYTAYARRTSETLSFD